MTTFLEITASLAEVFYIKSVDIEAASIENIYIGRSYIGALSIRGVGSASITHAGTGVADVRDGYIGNACIMDATAVRDAHFKDTNAIRDTCFRDTSAVQDTRFRDASAGRDACFRDVDILNRLAIYLKCSRILKLNRFSPTL